ncbi:MAG: lamin tail domain-containing protein [bacterium]|nr:lamin tail domain-containing protein [bacterium]
MKKVIYALIFFISITAQVYAQPTISEITPTIGINKGTISVTIIGSGFQSGATVILTKFGIPDIIGTPTTVIESNTITTTFDLKSVPIGSYSVVVTNPVNQSGTFTDGLKVIPQLLISEVYYDTKTSGQYDEFIELFNNTPFLINLSGYKISDIGATVTFPSKSVFPAYSTITITRRGTVSYVSFGKKFDFEWQSSDSDIPDMSGGVIQLSDSGEAIILLDKDGSIIDVVTYENGTYTGVISHTAGVVKGQSLQREPPNQDTDNCNDDFTGGTPTPTTLRNILVLPTSGTVGTFVTITGQGFFATEGIIVDFGTTTTIATTTTDASGSFSTTFTATLQPDWGSVTVSATGLTSKAKVTMEFNLIPLPLLKFDKQVTSSGSATPGATLTYTLYYENIGSGTATNVVITDAIPDGTIYITNSASGVGTIFYSHDGGLIYDGLQSEPVTHIRWELLSALPPGGSGSVSFKVRIE